MREMTLTVTHRSGLHARPAALLVEAARQFSSDVTLTYGERSAAATSILEVLALGVDQGARIGIRAVGVDENDALETLASLLATDLGDGGGTVIRGVPSSPGIAIGPVYRCCRSEVVCERKRVADRAAEQQRFLGALAVAQDQLRSARAGVHDDLGAGHAAMFSAQALMMEDPVLIRSVLDVVECDGTNVECALLEAAESYAERLEQLGSEYLRERAADVRDVIDRLLRVLLGLDESPFADLSVPSIVVARNIAPLEVALLDKSRVLGLVTAEGGPTSHAAIIARGMGLPAVVGAGDEVLSVAAGTPVVVDGSGGMVVIDPDTETTAAFERKRRAFGVALAEARAHALEPAATREGQRIGVFANVGNVGEATSAIEAGADGIGLLRTEFLYLGRRSLPDEEEQYGAYCAVFDAVGDLPIVLRTLDLGSDKEVPYLTLPRESNPFLGLRAIRLGLARPELLRPQLRAALRAGFGHDVRLLLPLIATVGEVLRARSMLEECRSELRAEGFDVDEETEVGAMVEVPAAALMIDQLAEHVDFFSIGTNDLSQYVMAADRTNAGVASLVSGFQPALLRMVASVISGAHAHGKRVGLCGELAGEPAAIPILLGLGLDEFSMSPPAIPAAKQILRTLTMAEADDIAISALDLASPEEVLAMVHDRVPSTRAAVPPS